MSTKCSSLNVIYLHNFIGCGLIGRYGLVGVDIFRGRVSLWGWLLRFPMVRIRPSVSVEFLLLTRYRTLRHSSSTLSACFHVP